jgi:hypothetical protein
MTYVYMNLVAKEKTRADVYKSCLGGGFFGINYENFSRCIMFVVFSWRDANFLLGCADSGTCPRPARYLFQEICL